MTLPDSPLRNLEGRSDYDVVWPWEKGELAPGVTAVLRVRNEARSLPFVLPPLLRTMAEVVLVDNGSDDGTPDVARSVATGQGLADRLTVTEYPFAVSRCGSEHLATPERSVHSLAYFYNWSFAQVRTRSSLKWDGDMVLTTEGEAVLGDLSWQLDAVEAVVFIPRHTLFLESDRVGHLDLGLWNSEPWIYPTGPEYVFAKAFEWEMRLSPDEVRRIRLPEGLCVELKYLDSDEFAHWGDVGEFSGSRTTRKDREWRLVEALRQGRHDLPDVHRIEAPEGWNVVDYVTRVWLPRAPRPLVPRSLRG